MAKQAQVAIISNSEHAKLKAFLNADWVKGNARVSRDFRTLRNEALSLLKKFKPSEVA